jgi:hypothetical protein
MKSFVCHHSWLFLLLLVGQASVFAKTSAVTDRDQIVFSAGVSGIFDDEHNPSFVLEYRFSNNWKGVQPWLGLGWATDGAVFAGGGALYSLATADGAWALTVGTGPGYYERHQGADLGSHLEFCTFAEVSRNLPWRHRVMIRIMHISNGGITEQNPGNELLLLGYSMPLP